MNMQLGGENKMKICFVSSSGGHLEQIMQLKGVFNTYDCFFVTSKTKASESMKEKKYLVNDLSRKDTNIFQYIIKTIECIKEANNILNIENPDIVITTGAGAAIPLCLLAKFKKKKLIYIESFARIDTPNATGKLLYYFADVFIIQWPELKKYFPKAIYGGWIY